MQEHQTNRGRSEYLRTLYGTVSSRFDAIMDVLYGGRDREWRECGLEALPTGGRILEVGAGTGRTEAIQSVTDDYVSFDISRSMLTASDSVKRPVQGDVHTLPFESDSFDGVIGVLLLSTRINQRRAVAEARRVCKPGGRIVFVDAFGSSKVHGRTLDGLLTLLTYPLAFDFGVDIESIAADLDLELAAREPAPNDMKLIELVTLRP